MAAVCERCPGRATHAEVPEARHLPVSLIDHVAVAVAVHVDD
jgi:hypothetical protein